MPMRGPRSPSTHTRLAHIDMWCGYMVVGHSAFSGQYVFLAAICNANEASHTLHSDQYETIQVNIKFSIYLYFFYLYIFLIFYGGGVEQSLILYLYLIWVLQRLICTLQQLIWVQFI